MGHNLCSKNMRMKLAYNGHDIEAIATEFENGDWRVQVTIE
jgi:hypothetical protein